MSFIEEIDLKKNWFVEASAGTGKTYTIQQIVARLVKERCSLKKILIVTYTEKAAGELKDRIRRKLEEVLDSENKLQEEPDVFETALREVDNASIFTIHSFCQKALKEFAYDAGRPFDLNMIDDSEVSNVIDEWARDKWPQDPLYQMLIEHCSSASSLENDLKEKLKKAILLYLGKSADGQEIVEMDSADAPNLQKWPENFDELLTISDIQDNFKILKADSNFALTKTKSIADFIKTMKKWDGGLLLNGIPFKNSKTLNWNPETYNAFLFFKGLNTLENLDKKNYRRSQTTVHLFADS